MDRYVKVDDVMGLINTSNRGNCDYFIVDQIEELCVSKKTITETEIRAKAIEEFANKMKAEIYDRINDISERQRNYEAGSDMSLTYSHMMGALRDVIGIVSDTKVKLKGE